MFIILIVTLASGFAQISMCCLLDLESNPERVIIDSCTMELFKQLKLRTNKCHTTFFGQPRDLIDFIRVCSITNSLHNPSVGWISELVCNPLYSHISVLHKACNRCHYLRNRYKTCILMTSNFGAITVAAFKIAVNPIPHGVSPMLKKIKNRKIGVGQRPALIFQ